MLVRVSSAHAAKALEPSFRTENCAAAALLGDYQCVHSSHGTYNEKEPRHARPVFQLTRFRPTIPAFLARNACISHRAREVEPNARAGEAQGHGPGIIRFAVADGPVRPAQRPGSVWPFPTMPPSLSHRP